MRAPDRLVLATRNLGKLAEFQRLLRAADLDVELLGLADLPAFPEAPETDPTFAGNARAKARDAVAATGLACLADDSGLEVDALSGMPGVLSARWSGTHGNDAANRDLLLAQLRDVPVERRGAAFACAAAFQGPAGEQHVVEARWRGAVGFRAAGEHGFGYDPVFTPDGFDITAAQLEPGVKDQLSHRGQAMRLMIGWLTG